MSSNNAYQCCCKVKNNKYVNKLVYLPLGRKWGDFNPCLNTNTVLFFGRIAKYKGLNNLVNICSDCPRIFFNIVGKPINEQDVFLIDKLKKMPNVKVCDKYVNEKEMCSFFIVYILQVYFIVNKYTFKKQYFTYL